ncbi:hypothetical protein Pyn_41190 [Prunus yedoensis var. nudiflora]|uniref:Uncharacterized protein n=1 Tax=Prunus yedoensis var. nudiflora TaxID=2094558 RepID=A0A314YI38_PRUYE|nr:hypothetical protein Pyn_41190 [Prunus yedoensis var. nudiflora]
MSRLGAAPYQMNPNVYRTMVSVQALWWRVPNFEPTLNQMMHCFLLMKIPHQVVELDRADLSAVEQEEVNQVLAWPSIEKATDKLLVSDGLSSTTSESVNEAESK